MPCLQQVLLKVVSQCPRPTVYSVQCTWTWTFLPDNLLRRDLVKRHMSGHNSEHQRKRKRPAPDTGDGRVSQACKSCAASKLKCDQVKPCRRCRDKNAVCDYMPEGVSCHSSPGLDRGEAQQQRRETTGEAEDATEAQGIFTSPPAADIGTLRVL